MFDDDSLIQQARARLDAGGTVADVLALFDARGVTDKIPRIQALRGVVPLGLSLAIQIVDAHGDGEPHLARLDRARLDLLTHPAAPALRNGLGHAIYQFFRDAALHGYAAWTIVPIGRDSGGGNAFHFWWREDIGAREGDPLFGLIAGSPHTLADYGDALQRAVGCDPVLARHVELLHVTPDRVSCRFHLDAPRPPDT